MSGGRGSGRRAGRRRRGRGAGAGRARRPGRGRRAGRRGRGRSGGARRREPKPRRGTARRRAGRDAPGSPRSRRTHAPSESTKTQLAAPRESASRPRPPEPANRSQTSAPSTGPIRLKAVSRTKSEVGRVAVPRGASKRRPLSSPAMIRIGGLRRARWGRRRRAALRPRRARGRLRRAALRRARAPARAGRGRAQPREAELPEAGLTRAEELALAAQLEVALGELEAVSRLDERLEPGAGPRR